MDSVKPNFSGAHEELLEDAVSIEDIDEVLEKLATAGISGTETDEPVIGELLLRRRRRKMMMRLRKRWNWISRQVNWTRLRIQFAFTCARWAWCRLLKREQEVSIAKRIEWGQKRAQKGITRSPMAVAELLKIGAELEAGTIGIRDVVELFRSDGNRRARGQDRRVFAVDDRRHSATFANSISAA